VILADSRMTTLGVSIIQLKPSHIIGTWETDYDEAENEDESLEQMDPEDLLEQYPTSNTMCGLRFRQPRAKTMRALGQSYAQRKGILKGKWDIFIKESMRMAWTASKEERKRCECHTQSRLIPTFSFRGSYLWLCRPANHFKAPSCDRLWNATSIAPIDRDFPGSFVRVIIPQHLTDHSGLCMKMF